MKKVNGEKQLTTLVLLCNADKHLILYYTYCLNIRPPFNYLYTNAELLYSSSMILQTLHLHHVLASLSSAPHSLTRSASQRLR